MSIKTLFTVLILLPSLVMMAQDKKQAADKMHKIIFQLSAEDTLVHKALMRQVNNVLAASPQSTIEIVCHGPGINLLLRDKTTVYDKIQGLKLKGVHFEACENTLKERNILKEKIIPEAGFVPSALIEIVTRQEEGWSYIKAGF